MVWCGCGVVRVRGRFSGVAVDGESGRVFGSEWRGCGLVTGLRCGFVFRWGWFFVGLWFVGSVGGGVWTGLLV